MSFNTRQLYSTQQMQQVNMIKICTATTIMRARLRIFLVSRLMFNVSIDPLFIILLWIAQVESHHRRSHEQTEDIESFHLLIISWMRTIDERNCT